MMMRLPDSWRTDPASGPIAAVLGADAPSRAETVGFPLVQPSGTITPAMTGGRMPRQFTATILLDQEWQLDVEAVAATVALRFPTIGRIDARRAISPDGPGAVLIDGAVVTMQMLPGRVPADRLSPPLGPIRNWDPELAVRHHVGAVEISCGGDLTGLEGAEAYAAVVHFVATATCRVAPASAVLWREGCVLSSPDAFADSAEKLLAGRMPVTAWVSFAAIVPKGFEPAAATGVVTYGMRHFIGRELELAPRPGDPRDAHRCISRIARRALDNGLMLAEGQQLTGGVGDMVLTVRERTYWLRRDLSAYVLVAADSVVDSETLKPRSRVA